MTLLPDVQKDIDRHCSNGDLLLDEGQFDVALAAYQAAMALIPEPKENWEASTWIYTAIGDTLSYMCNFAEALQAFQKAIASPDGLGNPYIHLKLGECQFEMGNFEKAANELTRAYMSEGPEIFEGEDQKYFEFLSTRIRMD